MDRLLIELLSTVSCLALMFVWIWVPMVLWWVGRWISRWSGRLGGPGAAVPWLRTVLRYLVFFAFVVGVLFVALMGLALLFHPDKY